jgi:hypothetical protein
VRSVHRLAMYGRRIRAWACGPEVSQRRISKYLKSAAKMGPVQRRPPSPDSIATVVACYGHAPFLERMFESLTRQTTY